MMFYSSSGDFLCLSRICSHGRPSTRTAPKLKSQLQREHWWLLRGFYLAFVDESQHEMLYRYYWSFSAFYAVAPWLAFFRTDNQLHQGGMNNSAIQHVTTLFHLLAAFSQMFRKSLSSIHVMLKPSMIKLCSFRPSISTATPQFRSVPPSMNLKHLNDVSTCSSLQRGKTFPETLFSTCSSLLLLFLSSSWSSVASHCRGCTIAMIPAKTSQLRQGVCLATCSTSCDCSGTNGFIHNRPSRLSEQFHTSRSETGVSWKELHSSKSSRRIFFVIGPTALAMILVLAHSHAASVVYDSQGRDICQVNECNRYCSSQEAGVSGLWM